MALIMVYDDITAYVYSQFSQATEGKNLCDMTSGECVKVLYELAVRDKPLYASAYNNGGMADAYGIRESFLIGAQDVHGTFSDRNFSILENAYNKDPTNEELESLYTTQMADNIGYSASLDAFVLHNKGVAFTSSLLSSSYDLATPIFPPIGELRMLHMRRMADTYLLFSNALACSVMPDRIHRLFTAYTASTTSLQYGTIDVGAKVCDVEWLLMPYEMGVITRCGLTEPMDDEVQEHGRELQKKVNLIVYS